MPTKIDWCDEVWNPVTGCSKISPGCEHCYAERMAKRLAGRFGYPKRNPFCMTVHKNRMELPLRWKKSRRIFINSMGDLFHDAVPFRRVDGIIDVIAMCQQHTFLMLTKRPVHMKAYFDDLGMNGTLPNLWLGVTVENSDYLWRVKELLQIPAAKRFVSVEPMLGEIRFDRIPVDMLKDGVEAALDMLFPKTTLDWIICGGETGPGARPMMSEWVTSLRDQCVNADVPFFFKGWGTALRPKDVTYQLIEGREWKQIPRHRFSVDPKLTDITLSYKYPTKKHRG